MQPLHLLGVDVTVLNDVQPHRNFRAKDLLGFDRKPFSSFAFYL